MKQKTMENEVDSLAELVVLFMKIRLSMNNCVDNAIYKIAYKAIK